MSHEPGRERHMMYRREPEMPTQSNDVLEQHEWTYQRVRAAFVRGTIGEKTFEVSLRHLGLTGQDAQAEINLAKSDMLIRLTHTGARS